MNRQDDAVSAIEKLKECGADDLSENDGNIIWNLKKSLQLFDINSCDYSDNSWQSNTQVYRFVNY